MKEREREIENDHNWSRLQVIAAFKWKVSKTLKHLITQSYHQMETTQMDFYPDNSFENQQNLREYIIQL